jgi:hypothetical protein
MDTCLLAGKAATSSPTVITSPMVNAPSSPPWTAAATALAGDDDNTVEEPAVIVWHPYLRAPGQVSLFEAMGTTHFALH